METWGLLEMSWHREGPREVPVTCVEVSWREGWSWRPERSVMWGLGINPRAEEPAWNGGNISDSVSWGGSPTPCTGGIFFLFKQLGISVLPLTPTGLEASSPSLHGKTGAPNHCGSEAPSVAPRRQSLKGWWSRSALSFPTVTAHSTSLLEGKRRADNQMHIFPGPPWSVSTTYPPRILNSVYPPKLPSCASAPNMHLPARRLYLGAPFHPQTQSFSYIPWLTVTPATWLPKLEEVSTPWLLPLPHFQEHQITVIRTPECVWNLSSPPSPLMLPSSGLLFPLLGL